MPMPLKDLDQGHEVTAGKRKFEPSHFRIEIQQWSLLSNQGLDSDDKYKCNSFEAGGGHRWRLTIYPRGDYVSGYLSVADPQSMGSLTVNAIITIFLLDQKSKKYYFKQGEARFEQSSPSWGFSKFLSKRSLRDIETYEYLKNDKCMFGAEVFVLRTTRTKEYLSLIKPPPTNWKKIVKQYSQIKKESTIGDFWSGGYQWKVCLTPEGRAHGVSIFLYFDKTNPENHLVKAKYTIWIRNQLNGANHRSYVGNHWISKGDKCGSRNFIKTVDMRDKRSGFVHSDTCSVEVEVAVLAISIK